MRLARSREHGRTQGDGHNCYGIENATYDHIEPVWGVYSAAPLDDLTVYDDDVLVHGSDYAPDGAANLGYFRPFGSLVDTTAMDGNCADAQPGYGKNEMYPCVEEVHDFGWAITGNAIGPSDAKVGVVAGCLCVG